MQKIISDVEKAVTIITGFFAIFSVLVLIIAGIGYITTLKKDKTNDYCYFSTLSESDYKVEDTTSIPFFTSDCIETAENYINELRGVST